jgi:hypothetical protein
MQQTDAEQRYTSPRGLAELWAGVVLAPLAWSAHLSISYFLAGVVCGSPWNLALLAVSVLLAGVALIGAWFAWRNYTATGREWPRGDRDGVLIRSRFLAVGGLLLTALSVLLIVVQTIPMLVLNPCS